MFTTIVYNSSRAGAQATLLALSAITDAHVRGTGNDYVVPSLNQCVGEYAFHGTAAAAGSVTLAQFQSPSLRSLLLKDVSRAHDSNTVLNERMIEMHLQDPIVLAVNELAEFWLANGALASAYGYGAVWLADGPLAKVSGNIQTVACTTSFTPTVNVWSLGTITITQSLPAGQYNVVGMRVISAATAGIARLVFVGGIWRPGCPITTTIMTPDLDAFNHGNMGVWGTFPHNTPPSLEVCEVAAVANPAVYLDLIKVG
jgi:hypothetical protein